MSKRARYLVPTVLVLIAADVLVSPLKVDHVHVSLSAETLWQVGPLPITNALLGSWLAMAVLILLAWRATRRLELTPRAGSLQNMIEAVIETLLDYLARFGGDKARAFFPVAGTLFLYILTMNWLGLMPGFGSIGIWRIQHGHEVLVPLLRGGTSDLNTTIALAVVSVGAGQAYGVRFRGWRQHLQRYVAVGKVAAFMRQILKGKRPQFGLLVGGLMDMFIGVLEIFEEITKVLSFSFRLFGNVFGGEVLLGVMAFLMPYLASLPFLALEVFTGFIQAMIFAVLSTAFFARAAASHEHLHDHAEQDAEPEPTALVPSPIT